MDTLCIPPKERHKKLKFEQIARMTSIYSRAFAVLVLDSGLISIREPNWDTKLQAQIMTCGWATRSWCYQEAVLADRCAFRLADRILLLDRSLDFSAAWLLLHSNKFSNLIRLRNRDPSSTDLQSEFRDQAGFTAKTAKLSAQRRSSSYGML